MVGLGRSLCGSAWSLSWQLHFLGFPRMPAFIHCKCFSRHTSGDESNALAMWLALPCLLWHTALSSSAAALRHASHWSWTHSPAATCTVFHSVHMSWGAFAVACVFHQFFLVKWLTHWAGRPKTWEAVTHLFGFGLLIHVGRTCSIAFAAVVDALGFMRLSWFLSRASRESVSPLNGCPCRGAACKFLGRSDWAAAHAISLIVDCQMDWRSWNGTSWAVLLCRWDLGVVPCAPCLLPRLLCH